MEHKPNILLIGFQNSLIIESMNHIAFVKCTSVKSALDLIIKNDYSLVISKFQLSDKNALFLSQSIDSINEYNTNSTPKKTKLLVVTSNSEEELQCKEKNLLYYPEDLDLKMLVLRLIELPKEPKKVEKKQIIIDFKELFIRVDNNREFIQTVIEKFFAIKESRLNDIKEPLQLGEFKKAKDAAHKLKGVLANFSMQEARITIIELEKLIMDKNQKLALQKFEQLLSDIKTAKQFYDNNLDQFKN